LCPHIFDCAQCQLGSEVVGGPASGSTRHVFPSSASVITACSAKYKQINSFGYKRRGGGGRDASASADSPGKRADRGGAHLISEHEGGTSTNPRPDNSASGRTRDACAGGGEDCPGKRSNGAQLADAL